MVATKFKRIYLFLNISIMFIILILFITPCFLIGKVAEIYYAGIFCRVTLGLWLIFNGIWNACTDYYSILKNNRFQKNRNYPNWMWWLIFIVGIGCLITAYMGFGFNGVKKPPIIS